MRNMKTGMKQLRVKKLQRARSAQLLSFRDFHASGLSNGPGSGAGGAPGVFSGAVERVGGPSQQPGGSEVVVNHVLV